jgi:diguanylate cyclase (GGDEF)-like protein
MDSTPTPSEVPASAWMAWTDIEHRLLRGYPGTVLVLGAQGEVLAANPAGEERLGGKPEAGALLAPLPDDEGETASREAALQPGALHEWALRHRDGSTQAIHLAIAPLNDKDGNSGKPAGLVAIEPWPPEGAEAPLPFQHHDLLTGLPTHAVLADRAEIALQRAARHKSVVAVLLVEIAGFAALCKEHGNSVGDDLLRASASRLHFQLRKTDTAVRLEGGQFLVLLVDLHNAEEAPLVAEKMRQALSAPINVGVAKLPLTIRVGVACSPRDGDQLLPLMQAAEKAAST